MRVVSKLMSRADSPNSQLVDGGPTEHQSTSRKSRSIRVLVSHKVHATHDNEHGAKTTLSVKVERSTTESKRHQDPGSEYTSAVDSVLTKDERQGARRRKSALLQKVVAVPRERVSGQVLNRPDHADDFGSTTVDSLETLLVGRADSHLTFELGGVCHHLRDGGVGLVRM